MKTNKKILDYLMIILGAGSMATALNLFLLPSNVAPGGFSGIAAIVYYLTGFPVGGVIALLNIPLIVLSVRWLGKKFVFRTLIGIVAYSVAAELVPVINLAPDKILSGIFGGFLMGAGVGIIMNAGATTGGSEVVASLINSRFKFISVAAGIFAVDAIVIVAYAIIFEPLSGLYAIFSLFISTWVVERVTSGLRRGRALIIVSKKREEIKKHVLHTLSRGVTEISAVGGYSGEQNPLLFVTVGRPHEAEKLKRMIYEIDAGAFIIAWNANEVYGYGFSMYKIT